MIGFWLGPQFWENGGCPGECSPSKQSSQNDDNDFFDWNILYPLMLLYYDYIRLALCLVSYAK